MTIYMKKKECFGCKESCGSIVYLCPCKNIINPSNLALVLCTCAVLLLITLLNTTLYYFIL